MGHYCMERDIKGDLRFAQICILILLSLYGIVRKYIILVIISLQNRDFRLTVFMQFLYFKNLLITSFTIHESHLHQHCPKKQSQKTSTSIALSTYLANYEFSSALE